MVVIEGQYGETEIPRVTPFAGSSPHAGGDPNIRPQTMQNDPHFNQLVDSFFEGGYDQLFHQLQRDDLEDDYEEDAQHLQIRIDQQHQQAKLNEVL